MIRRQLRLLLLVLTVSAVYSCAAAEYEKDGSCVSCPSNCQQCSANNGSCVKCNDGYDLSKRSGENVCEQSPAPSESWKIIVLVVGLLLLVVAAAGVSVCFQIVRKHKRVSQSSVVLGAVVGTRSATLNQRFREAAPTMFDPSKDECTICLGHSTNLLTSCDHRFHKECLHDWLLVRNSCPNCNTLDPAVKALCSSCQGYSR